MYLEGRKRFFFVLDNSNKVFILFRCGYRIFTQKYPHSDLDDPKNYGDLLRTILLAVQNKRPCQNLCS